MNFIHIAGNLGADPETRFTQTGKKVTTLRVAVTSRRGQNESTIWWRATIWGDQFEKMMPYLKKGSGVMVFGEMHKPEIFNDKEGKPQVSMEMTAVHIQFNPFGRSGGGGSPAGQANQPSGATGMEGAHGAAPFGAPQDGLANPYMGFPGPANNRTPIGAGQGETFDDEVPF